MSMSAQDWLEIELRHSFREIECKQDVREVEFRRHPRKPRRPLDPLIYPAILAILGVIGTLAMFVHAIRTANHHLLHRESVQMMYRPQED